MLGHKGNLAGLRRLDRVEKLHSLNNAHSVPCLDSGSVSCHIRLAGSVAAVEGLDICGKTGTAQNPHGEDHSIFICFAPMDNPQIAVAAYVENGGFGATWAAPIASLLVEKYLNGEISDKRKGLEKRVLEGDLMDRVKVKK